MAGYSQNFNLADKSKNIRLAVESQYIGPCRLTVIRQHYTDSLISKLECLPYFNTGDIDKNSGHGKVYSIQHYVIKFVSDLRQFGGFLCTPVSTTIKLTAMI